MCIVNLLTDVFSLQSILQGELQAYPQTRLGRQWTYRTGSAPAGLCDNPACDGINIKMNSNDTWKNETLMFHVSTCLLVELVYFSRNLHAA